MRFYLGTHEPTWLNRARVPLFVSTVRLADRCKRKLPRARVPWALDSGGFSVLSKFGRYPWTAAEYAALVRRYDDEIGLLDFASIQDWMCEADVINGNPAKKIVGTGLSVAEHQRRTVASWVELRAIAPDLPWIPVLQGFTHAEYLRCLDLYAAAGTDLTQLPTVGLGSICRREDTSEAEAIIRDLAGRGLRIHAFGLKLGGLELCADVLESADSLAWSYGERCRASERRKLARQAAAAGILTSTAVAPKNNDARAALDWLARVEHRAGMKEAPELLSPCPFCTSTEVRPPTSSDWDYCCVACGESWGDIFEPALGD